MSEEFSWHGYERTWRSSAHKIDLRPVQVRCEDRVLARVDGRALDSKKVDQIRCQVAAQAAVGLLVGGASKGKNLVQIQHKEILEVRVVTKWWPFTRFAPALSIGERGRLKYDLVLCACPPSTPFMYEECWVVGWVNVDGWKAVAEPTDWGWKIKDLRGMAEITDDQLLNPRLPVGMSRRRYADDPGIPEYVEEYFGVDDARSHTEA